MRSTSTHLDGQRHESVLRHPQLAARSFSGVLPEDPSHHGMEDRLLCGAGGAHGGVSKIHQYVTLHAPSNPARPCGFPPGASEHHRELPAFYEAKRDRLAELLAPSRFHFTEPRNLLPTGRPGHSDEPDHLLARRSTESIGAATIPVSVFYADPPGSSACAPLLCKDETTLVQAAERLCAI